MGQHIASQNFQTRTQIKNRDASRCALHVYDLETTNSFFYTATQRRSKILSEGDRGKNAEAYITRTKNDRDVYVSSLCSSQRVLHDTVLKT